MTANRLRMILLLPWAGCRIKKLKRTTCAACAKARAAAGGCARAGSLRSYSVDVPHLCDVGSGLMRIRYGRGGGCPRVRTVTMATL